VSDDNEPRIITLQRSQAREMQCRGCGRGILAFKDTRQLAHQPPECRWFRELVESEGDNCEIAGEANIVDDVSN
jgi:hypothetical protein